MFQQPVGKPLKKSNSKLKYKNMSSDIPPDINTNETVQEVNMHYPIKYSAK